jgi:cytochrome c-type biogenesis protein CcmF
LAVGLWVVTTHSFDIGKRLLAGQRLPLAYVGMTLAHLGFAAAVIGVAVTSTQSVERDVRMAPQDQYQLGEFQVTFLGVGQVQGPNYVADRGHFVVRDDNGNQLFELYPEKRRYLAGGSIMTEAGIDAGLFADTYISLGEPLDDQAWAVRLHRKPLVRWIWLGALLMGFGGLVSLCDGRYRRLRKREMKPVAQATA